MKFLTHPASRPIGFFCLLTAFCCLPVWSVEYFVNQDGSAHLNSANLMLELLRDNTGRAGYFAFNSLTVPNSIGHWLMAVLLVIFAPFTVTKIIVTLTFCLPVAAAGWLRYRTSGTVGVKTAMLFAAAVSFNWLWLVGFYNFLFGLAVVIFAAGLFYTWRESMTVGRTLALSFLFLTCYFSHIVSFVVLGAAIFFLTVTAGASFLRRNLVAMSAAALPVFPLALIYRSVAAAGGGGFSPVWRSLTDPLSPLAWLNQLRTADPFILISRKSLPFVESPERIFAVFAPILWIGLAVACLSVATILAKSFERKRLAFLILFLGGTLAALAAPDDFGLNNGSVLRERLLLGSLFFCLPLFDLEKTPFLKRLAQFALLFVIVFQTATLWDYALKSNETARNFMAAAKSIPDGSRIATISVVTDGTRFHSVPVTMMSNYLAMSANNVSWDNYEIGHHLFPVIGRTAAEKAFVFDLTTSNAFALDDPGLNFDLRAERLAKVLAENHQNIDVLIVAGHDSRLDRLYGEWFHAEPFFQNDLIRVFRHK